MPNKTITVNGRAYDAITGLPVAGSAPKKAPVAPSSASRTEKAPTKTSAAPAVKKPAAKKPVVARSQKAASSDVHASSLQRTQTLRNRTAKKPVAAQKVVTKRAAPGRHMDIARSSSVSKFAPHPVTKPAASAAAKPTAAKAPTRAVQSAPVAKPAVKPAAAKPVARKASPAQKPDRPAQVHPTAQRAIEKAKAKQAPARKATSAKQVKDNAISSALNTPKQKTNGKKAFVKKWQRRALIVLSIAVVIIGGLFLVYKFIPSLSVAVAANQSGVNASFPEYTPDGFSLSQPVNYSDGEVVLKFVSNSNDTFYTITQTRSSWDSSAVLDNVVRKSAGENYVTTKERGLTIYTYDESAAWVNKGVLYKIKSSSSAILSGEQVRKIATSL